MKHAHVLSGVLFALICSGSAYAQPTTLAAGDIAFTGYNADDNIINGATANDDISFILLRNINAGTVIYFTDFGWRSDINGFQTANSCGPSTGATTDGVVQWTAGTNMSYGTQVYIRCRINPSANVGTAIGYQAAFGLPGEYLSLATGGDEVFAFQGTLASPTLIAGMNMNGAWDPSLVCTTFTSSASVQPPALSTNNYSFAITPEVDNARLKSTVTLTGIAATDRAAIHNNANWDVNDMTAFALPAPGVGLPVTFISFSLQKKEQAVLLTWEVADEYQLEGYHIERSLDAQSWEETGKVSAAGRPVYHFTDNTSEGNGRLYYRIRSIDLNGSYNLSPIATLNRNDRTFQVRAYPNPSTTYIDISINIPRTTQLAMQLVNAEGKKILQRNAAYSPGTHIIRLYEMKQQPKGVYFLQIRSAENGFDQNIQLVKQ